jgi:uncharacterized phage-associated protein
VIQIIDKLLQKLYNLVVGGLKMTNVLDVSKYIVCKFNEQGKNITMLKLQKILYFCQGYFMAHNNGRAMFKEDFRAWKLGPVLYNVYKEFNDFSSVTCDINIEGEVKRIIDLVLEDKGNYTAWQLVEETHKKGPWATIFNENKWGDYDFCNEEIPKDMIYKYFRNEVIKG